MTSCNSPSFYFLQRSHIMTPYMNRDLLLIGINKPGGTESYKFFKAREGRMHTQRRLQRRYLFHYLNVLDQNTDELFGLLSDITTEGCMLLCENSIKTNNRFYLKLEFPPEIAEPREIIFDAESRWSSADINPNYNSAGFQFQNISQASKDAINLLIRELGFENHEKAE